MQSIKRNAVHTRLVHLCTPYQIFTVLALSMLIAGTSSHNQNVNPISPLTVRGSPGMAAYS